MEDQFTTSQPKDRHARREGEFQPPQPEPDLRPVDDPQIGSHRLQHVDWLIQVQSGPTVDVSVKHWQGSALVEGATQGRPNEQVPKIDVARGPQLESARFRASPPIRV